MITIMFRVTIKPGREDECAALLKDVTASTRAEDDGCINYTFFRRGDDPRQLVLLEQWRDQPSLIAHLERLQRVFGPVDDQEDVPHRRRLPKAFLALFEPGTEAIRYDVVE